LITFFCAAVVLSGCYEAGICLKVDKNPEWYGPFYYASLEQDQEKFYALARRYEYTGDPQTLAALAKIYSTGFGDFKNEAEREQKIVDYLKKASLCGEQRALHFLAEAYEDGEYGLEPFPEMAQCLRRVNEANRKAIVCRLTLDEARMPEPSEVPFPRGEAYGDYLCGSPPGKWAKSPTDCVLP
jgi:hypothetical protein